MTTSSSLGTEVPIDFPVDSYDKVAYLHQFVPHGGGQRWRKEPVEQLRSGWMAVGFRFLGMARSDEEWRRSIATYGIAPAMPVRVAQEASLFEFFASACAVVESACYAVNASRVMAVGDVVGLTPSRQRLVNPASTAKELRRAFPDAPITRDLRTMLSSHEYRRLGQIRNVLSHRTAPPRLMYVTVGSTDSATTPADWALGIHGYESERLSAATTQAPRKWVAEALGQIADGFLPLLGSLAVQPDQGR